MKKTYVLLLFCLLTIPVQAQVFTFGPAVSGNVLWAEVNNNDYGVNPIPSYALGGFVRVKLLKLYIQPEVFYARKGVDFFVPDPVSNTDQKQSLRYETVDVNLMLGLQLFKFFNDDVGLRLHTGPGMNHNLDNSFVLNGDRLDEKDLRFKPNAFNWQAGIGVDVLNRFFVDFRYGVTLSDIVRTQGFNNDPYKIIPSFATVTVALKLIKDK